MMKEMDELRNAIKGKTDQRLDRMVRATNSPFTTAVLECPEIGRASCRERVLVAV